MWNILEKNKNIILKGFDGRPLRFTEKSHADRMTHELKENKKLEEVDYIVVEDNQNQ